MAIFVVLGLQCFLEICCAWQVLEKELRSLLCKAGADSDADILDQAEPVSSPFRAHRQQLLNMRFEEMTPEESRRCTERAMQSVPVSLPVGQVGGSPHDSLSSRRTCDEIIVEFLFFNTGPLEP